MEKFESDSEATVQCVCVCVCVCARARTRAHAQSSASHDSLASIRPKKSVMHESSKKNPNRVAWKNNRTTTETSFYVISRSDVVLAPV